MTILLATFLVLQSPWTTGSDAPPPDERVSPPQAPREQGAHNEPLDVPQPPPRRPARKKANAGLPNEIADPRLSTTKTRAELLSTAALDVETALVDVPGLWLRHVQNSAPLMQARGLSERNIGVVLDGVPLFDLAGLLPMLEQTGVTGLGRLTLHHGPRVIGAAPPSAAGVLSLDSGDPLVDAGEDLRLNGLLAGGYGGADLEKGVIGRGETGLSTSRVMLHAAVLNRELQRIGRPGALLFGSNGNGGAVGARADVVPMTGMHLFTSWQSSRSLETPAPDRCVGVDERGREQDCVRTVERGLDVWIAGGAQRFNVAGTTLVLSGRAHAQHAKAFDERAGQGIAFVEKAQDEGVRAGASVSLDARLPALALVDVIAPRASLSVDAYADRFDSAYFFRSTRFRDAEPPGDGLADPTKARRVDGASARFGSTSLLLAADGARVSLWAAARLALEDVAAPAVIGRSDEALLSSTVAPSAELGARMRLLEPLSAWVALTHVERGEDVAVLVGGPELARDAPPRPEDASFIDDAAEVGLSLSGPAGHLDALLWGAARATQTAWGGELRGRLLTGVDGLHADGVLAVVTVDEDNAPASGVPNPSGVLSLLYAPPTLPAGFIARARFLLPQQRLSPAEEVSAALCPERPTDEQIAEGAVQQDPCTGAVGAFLLDVGAHLDAGDIRIDVMAENLLDQRAALRDEPIGFGGTSFRAMLTIKL